MYSPDSEGKGLFALNLWYFYDRGPAGKTDGIAGNRWYISGVHFTADFLRSGT